MRRCPQVWTLGGGDEINLKYHCPIHQNSALSVSFVYLNVFAKNNEADKCEYSIVKTLLAKKEKKHEQKHVTDEYYVFI